MLLLPLDPHNGRGPLFSLLPSHGTFLSIPIDGRASLSAHTRAEIAFDARSSFTASPALFLVVSHRTTVGAGDLRLTRWMCRIWDFELLEPLFDRLPPK